MTFPQLGMRGRLLMSAVLPAILMVLILELVFLNRYQVAMERSFEERGIAIARQIGAAAEYAIFSGSREVLQALAESSRQIDSAIVSVRIMDQRGRPVVLSGGRQRHVLPFVNAVQIHSGVEVTSLQLPIRPAVLLPAERNDPWNAGELDARSAPTGFIQLDLARAELQERQREVLWISLAVMLFGMLLASWLSWRIAGGVLASLDAAHTALRRQKEYAELLARTDALTGLANRRAFDEAAEQEVQRVRRYNTPLALVMADLDHFKAINDRHGHHVGDQVLQHFAHILLASVRNLDLVGRWGGEEFAILMPGTDLEEAVQAAERMRQAVLEAAPPLDDRACAYTASFGVAAFRSDTPTMVSLLGRADAALYRAKGSGRNRVEQG